MKIFVHETFLDVTGRETSSHGDLLRYQSHVMADQVQVVDLFVLNILLIIIIIMFIIIIIMFKTYVSIHCVMFSWEEGGAVLLKAGFTCLYLLRNGLLHLNI